jgi:hypothetical protein
MERYSNECTNKVIVDRCHLKRLLALAGTVFAVCAYLTQHQSCAQAEISANAGRGYMDISTDISYTPTFPGYMADAEQDFIWEYLNTVPPRAGNVLITFLNDGSVLVLQSGAADVEARRLVRELAGKGIQARYRVMSCLAAALEFVPATEVARLNYNGRIGLTALKFALAEILAGTNPPMPARVEITRALAEALYCFTSALGEATTGLAHPVRQRIEGQSRIVIDSQGCASAQQLMEHLTNPLLGINVSYPTLANVLRKLNTSRVDTQSYKQAETDCGELDQDLAEAVDWVSAMSWLRRAIHTEPTLLALSHRGYFQPNPAYPIYSAYDPCFSCQDIPSFGSDGSLAGADMVCRQLDSGAGKVRAQYTLHPFIHNEGRGYLIQGK